MGRNSLTRTECVELIDVLLDCGSEHPPWNPPRLKELLEKYKEFKQDVQNSYK